MIFNDGSLLVAHDAGGANQIISWIPEDIKNLDLKFYFRGPAKKIFRQKFPDQEIEKNFERALKNCSSLICGTGWQTDLEISAIIKGLKNQKYVIAVLDHWENYSSRFLKDSKFYIPNEIWVTDKYAFDIAKKEFSNVKIILKSDSYAKSFAEKVFEYSETEKNQILYLCEPMRSNWGKGCQGEFQAFNFFIKNLSKIGFNNSIPIKVRPHPSEEANKYRSFLNRFKSLNIKIEKNSSLELLVAESKWVVGCSSYALYLALMSNKIVYSSLPTWAEASTLPHNEIIYIREI